jgi:hypothetical protein
VPVGEVELGGAVVLEALVLGLLALVPVLLAVLLELLELFELEPQAASSSEQATTPSSFAGR